MTMADKNADFLLTQMKIWRSRSYEVLGAQIGNKITATVRVPKTLIRGQFNDAEKALEVFKTVEKDGWSLAGFSYDESAVLVDIKRDLF